MPSLTKLAAALVIGVGILGAGLALAGWWSWGRGSGAVAEPMPDFATLAPPDSPNWHLVLPAGFASTAPAQAECPVFALPVAELERRALDVIRRQPRVIEVAADPARRQYAFVQRTALMRFPDTVTVRFLDLGDGRASLALYSRSKVGHSDLGGNAARAADWLAAIAAAARNPGG